jgi:sugar lactone lactonase YvrE
VLVAVVLSAWTAHAAAATPYVVYTANNSSRGAVILRSDPTAGSLVEISRNGRQGKLFQNPTDIAVERNGDLVVADMGVRNQKDGAVIRVNPFTGHQTLVSNGAMFYDPAGIAVAPDGSLYVVDSARGANGGAVIRVDPATGAQKAISSDFLPLQLFDLSFGIAIDGDGSLVLVNRSLGGALPSGCGLAGSVMRVNAASGFQAPLAGLLGLANPYLRYPVGLAIDTDGSVVVANECGGGAGLVRVGPAPGAQAPITTNNAHDVLRTPERVALTPEREMLVSDYNGGADGDGSIVKVTRAGAQSTLSSGPLFNHPMGIALVANRPPIAALTVTPDVVAAGKQVRLDASGSRDPERLELVYEWDLDGNGSFETGSGSTPRANPRLATDGVRTLRVRVTDPHGGRSVAAVRLRVDGSMPLVTRVRATPRLPAAATTIHFRVSERAKVKLALDRGRRGQSRWVRARTIRRWAKRGDNAIRLRLRGLRPGHFRLVVTAVDPVGHKSPPRVLRLRVVRRGS